LNELNTSLRRDGKSYGNPMAITESGYSVFLQERPRSDIEGAPFRRGHSGEHF